MTDTIERCICEHIHATAEQDGVTSVFHRCRADGCGCAEYAPESSRPVTGKFSDARDALLRAARRLAAADRERADAITDLRRKARAMHGRVAIRETARRTDLSATSISTFFAGHLTISNESAVRVALEVTERFAGRPIPPVGAPEVPNG